MPEPRRVYTSVTNFLHCGDEYLFLLRKNSKKIDAGKLNGVGGKLESGEDYLTAAIRETQEETGYVVTPPQIKLSGVAKLESFESERGGYQEDWVFCFFKIAVPTKEIPLGMQTDDGQLIWLHKNEVLTSGYDLVDDLHICFPEIAKDENGVSDIFFFHEFANAKEKVEKYTLTRLPILAI